MAPVHVGAYQPSVGLHGFVNPIAQSPVAIPGPNHVSPPSLGVIQERTASTPSPTHSINPADWQLQASSVSSTTSPKSASPVPATGSVPTATLSGYVRDAKFHTGISGATVTYQTSGVCLLPIGSCPPTTRSTGGAGTWSLVVPASAGCVVVNDTPKYLTNQTCFIPSAGQTYNGIVINLTTQAIVSGILVGSDPTHETVTCTVVIQAVSRSGLTQGGNVVINNGHFNNVYVPPYPSTLSFDPLCPQYQPNHYWVNGTPGAVISMGTLILPVNTLVVTSVEYYNTKKLVSLSEIQLCSTDNPGNCAPKGTTVGSGVPNAWAPPGYDSLTVWANDPNGEGTLNNQSAIGYVPPLAPGHTFRLPVQYVVDQGLIQLNPQATYAKQLSKAPWGLGANLVVTTSSLDGYNQIGSYNPMTGNFSTVPSDTTCVAPDAAALVYAAPLRVSVSYEPDYSTTCSPFGPTWPIPEDLPIWGNSTIANVTPDQKTVVNIGFLNFTPGTYIEGSVSGSGAAPNNGNSPVTISAQWSDNTALSPTYVTAVTAQPIPPRSGGWTPIGCPSGSWTIFCVPVMFGPSEIIVKSTLNENYTWIDVKPGYYNGGPTLIQLVDTAKLQIINGVGVIAFANDSIRGVVLAQGLKTPPSSLTTVRVCPAGSYPTQEYCSSTIANATTGQFLVPATAGWNIVSVNSPLYLANSTWVYVNNPFRPANAGTIYLTEQGFVQGQVINLGGTGILQAAVSACPIATQGGGSGCSSVGTSQTTNTYGQYFGNLPARPLPLGAYQLVFSATGYTSNWTWINVTTPGEVVTASTVALIPQSTSRAHSVPSGGPTAPPLATSLGEWVDGDVVDTVSGLPVQGLTIQWQSPGGQLNQVGSLDINAMDDYNTSIPTGLYFLNFSAPSYHPTSMLVNVSGLDANNTLYLPEVTLVPLEWFAGRAVIGPLGWTYNTTFRQGLGPGRVAVQVCTQKNTACGATQTLDLGGLYNLSGPTVSGQYNVIKFTPGAPATPGTMRGGYNANQSITNVTAGVPVTVQTTPVLLDIFGGVAVRLTDQSNNNLTPIRYATATATVGTGSINTTIMLTGAGGWAWAILTHTSGKSLVTVTAFESAYLQGTLTNISSPDWQFYFGGDLALKHFGWLAGSIDAAGSPGAPVPWASGSVNIQVSKATTFT
ncbi:MAG TPA: hypothetical protein VGV64_04565, partial [Thermoplasmata archaeon]|nr:hypothetical protein [Thermoplasmata archaeon]